MSEPYNESTIRAIRAIKADALRSAATAIEEVWEGAEDFTPGHAAGQLRARAADIEAGVQG
jgi:hypothetical protein